MATPDVNMTQSGAGTAPPPDGEQEAPELLEAPPLYSEPAPEDVVDTAEASEADLPACSPPGSAVGSPVLAAESSATPEAAGLVLTPAAAVSATSSCAEDGVSGVPSPCASYARPV